MIEKKGANIRGLYINIRRLYINIILIILGIIFFVFLVLATAPTLTLRVPTRNFIPYHFSGNNINFTFTIDSDGSLLNFCRLQYGNVNYTVGNCNDDISNFTLYGHTGTQNTNDSVNAGAYGVVIKPSVNTWISGFNKTTHDQSTIGHLRNITGQNITTCAFVGSYCAFSTTYFLASGTQFIISANSTGAVDRFRKDSFAWPENSFYFQWNMSYINGQILTTDFYTIQALNISNVAPGTIINPAANRNITNILNVTSYENKTVILFVKNNNSETTVNISGWAYGIFENSQSFNSSVYELETQGYDININYSSSLYSAISADLYYNTTRFSGTRTGSGDHALFSRTISVPAIDANISKNILWAFYLTNTTGTFNYNSTPRTQYAAIINFSICGASPQNVPYIRFLFKNETVSEQNINATITSSWTYWTDDKTVNKSLSFSSATEVSNYTFCFSPSSKTINVDLDLDYANAYSEQRTYTLMSQSLTNSTAQNTLYLLPSALGVFSSYQTINSNGGIITNVLVTIKRNLNGVLKTVFLDLTDSSGRVTPFLNPDITYEFTFSKTGLTSQTQSITPISGESTQIVMGGAGNQISNSTLAGQNLSYSFVPENTSLNNNTVYSFGINVTGSGVSYVQFELKNETSNLIGILTANSEGLLVTSFNTGNYTTLIGYATITNYGQNLTVTQIWHVGENYVGDYSFYRQFTLWHDYGFKNGIRFFIVIAVIILMMIFLSRGEIIDTTESKMIVLMIIVWIFSFIGWLDVGLNPFSPSHKLFNGAELAGKYLIFTLTAVGVVALNIKRFMSR